MMRAQLLSTAGHVKVQTLVRAGRFAKQFTAEAGEAVLVTPWTPRFGDKVWLAAFEDEPREKAQVLSYDAPSGTVVVRLLASGQGDDDGIRELPLDQIEDLL